MTIAPANPGAVSETLNRSARRILQAGRQAEWSSAAIDAALPFCGRAALFTVQGAQLRLERSSFDSNAEVVMAASDGLAIVEALASLEPVAAAWSVRELSGAVVEYFGSPRSGQAFLFAVASGGRAVGLLICTAGGDGAACDLNGLELVSTLAGAAWELRRQRNDASAAASTGLIRLEAVESGTAASEEDSEWHRRARRFASVRVAELRLYQAAKVREGRESQKLYDLFREAIDSERVLFRAQFMEKSPSMVDYLHEELVRTLAQGEPDRMGENYPGAMVRI